VTILYDGDSPDQAERYLIGHMEEKPSDPSVSVMSPKSPLGAALLGAGAGEKVKYQAPNGMLSVKVVSVEAGS
jgi:transcription elongation factor GreA